MGDLLRAVALVSVAVGASGWGVVGFALFMLVLGATMIPRALGAPPSLDVSYCSVLLGGAWAAVLDLYLRFAWLDTVVHAAATGLIGVVAYVVMVRVGWLSTRVPRPGRVVVATGVGTVLALVWELLEWGGHALVDDRIQVGYEDTLGDLVSGLVGAALAGAVLLSDTLVRGPGSRRAGSPR
ncbi:hypothetical protein GHK92_02875 [Nocardioides sp. dk4132]|nr:hypothetical protein [Nocardioides sp. dk4132]QGA09559.1 hypothetical protein GFH29_04310 [Nocardioides sp. dk884]